MKKSIALFVIGHFLCVSFLNAQTKTCVIWVNDHWERPKANVQYHPDSLHCYEAGESPADEWQEKFYNDLAFQHAPIHYQDVDASKPKSDYITRINYDGDWRSDNNWNNVNQYPLSAHAYYSVVETSTHWFIIYAFFHPQDWDDRLLYDEHENDLEGVLGVIKKTTGYGKLEAMITVAHSDFYSYTRINSEYKNGSEDVDGSITYKNDLSNKSRPVICQEAKGHGLKAYPYASDFTGKEGEDGIIYYPSKTRAEVPSSSFDRNVNYKLVSLTANEGFWKTQLVEDKKSSNQRITFYSWGLMKSNSDGGCGDGSKGCDVNNVGAPWRWEDGDDGIFPGMLALDPAAVVKKYFTIPGSFSLVYTNNIYLRDLRNKGYNNQNKPTGWPEESNLETLLHKLQQ